MNLSTYEPAELKREAHEAAIWAGARRGYPKSRVRVKRWQLRIGQNGAVQVRVVAEGRSMNGRDRVTFEATVAI